MRRILQGILAIWLTAMAGPVLAHEEHHHGASAAQGQALTGEVVDVFCYLSHGKDGLGKAHADCAKKCIKSGLPVALKVKDQLYLAAMDSHDPANAQLANFAGQQVTVHGKVMERDGQHLISITEIDNAQ